MASGRGKWNQGIEVGWVGGGGGVIKMYNIVDKKS